MFEQLCKWTTSFLLLGTTIASAEVTQHFEIYGARSAEDLRYFHALGFDQVVLENHQLATVAHSLGMRVVLANWWSPETSWDQIEAVVNYASLLPNLTSINMMDEPMFNGAERFPPDYYGLVRERIRALAPNVRLSLSEYGPSTSWPQERRELFQRYLPAIDILRIDPYPVAANQPLRRVYDWVELSRHLMAESQRVLPLTVTLQTWNSGDGDVLQMPTIEQLRVMAFLAILEEVGTISFFDFNASVWDRIPGFQSGFAALIQELSRFSREHAGWVVNGTMDVRGTWTGRLVHAGQCHLISIDTVATTVSQAQCREKCQSPTSYSTYCNH